LACETPLDEKGDSEGLANHSVGEPKGTQRDKSNSKEGTLQEITEDRAGGRSGKSDETLHNGAKIFRGERSTSRETGRGEIALEEKVLRTTRRESSGR